MRSASGSYGSIDASGTVANKTYDVIYVDNSNGNNNNEGTSADTAVKTLATAMDKVSAGGIIILCSNYTGSFVYIEKSVAIKKSGQREIHPVTKRFQWIANQRGR